MSKVASVESAVPVPSVRVQSDAYQVVVSQSVVSQSVVSMSSVRGVSERDRPSALDVGEWRQVGSALTSVLSRVRVVAEASAKLSNVDGIDRSRMH